MGLTRASTGPLSYATLYRDGEAVFWGGTNPPVIAPQDTDIVHTVTSSDRLDLIATRFLSDFQLGWVIMIRNDMRLAPNDLVPGMRIFIPTRESLRTRGIVR
jgi:hypothetical protein